MLGGEWLENLLPIGRFARQCRLTVKALRYYDEIGLLRPAQVDPSSGSRYYRLAQAREARVIALLRSLEMPLAEIVQIVGARSPEVIAAALERHRLRLQQRLEESQRLVRSMERLIGGATMTYTVELTTLPEQPVLSIRLETTQEQLGQAIQAAMAELYASVSTGGVPSGAAGAPAVVYHEFTEERVEAEVCLPVEQSEARAGRAQPATLPGGLMARTVHTGPYTELGGAYDALAAWVQAHGHEQAGPVFEIYRSLPDAVPAEELLTEVLWPVR